MYFRDKNGLVWRQEQGGYRNIGISVKEQMVTFKKVSDIQIQLSAVMVPSLSDAMPITLREAVKQLKISEEFPLKPLKNLEVL